MSKPELMIDDTIPRSFEKFEREINDPQNTNGWQEFPEDVFAPIILKNNGLPGYIRCEVHWVDQGWGNRKGAIQLAYKAHGEIVFTKDLFGAVPHAAAWQEIEITFNDLMQSEKFEEIDLFDEGAEWTLIYRVGSPMHSLTINSFEMTMAREKPEELLDTMKELFFKKQKSQKENNEKVYAEKYN